MPAETHRKELLDYVLASIKPCSVHDGCADLYPVSPDSWCIYCTAKFIAVELQSLLALGERQETAEPPQELVKYLTMRRDFYKGGAVVDAGSEFPCLTQNDVCADAAEDLDKAISALAAHREGPATADKYLVRDFDSLIASINAAILLRSNGDVDDADVQVESALRQAEALAERLLKSAHREGRPPAAETPEIVAVFEQIAEKIASSADSKAQSQVEWEITEAQKSAYALGIS